MNQDDTKREASNGVTDTSNKGKILLVDDDKFLMDMYSMKFVKEGYRVEACLSVNDAISVLRGDFTPDAIVFDITMPDKDGFAFLEMIGEEKLAGEAIRIALTNQSDDSEKKRAEELGVTRYIVKASMIPSEVVNTVSQELDKRSHTA